MSRTFICRAPVRPKWSGGYGAGEINPSRIADDLFREEISGPWLTCYMLRRFGWPNIGSDNYKELMSWALTTPIDGLYLSVTPYLGGSNLHFGILFTDDVGRKIGRDLGIEAYHRRLSRDCFAWWAREGRHRYVVGSVRAREKGATLVKEYATTKDGKVFGLFERKPSHKVQQDLKIWFDLNPFARWFICNFRERDLKHSLPKMSERERAMRGNPFQRRCDRALRATMVDLLRPTNVRDVDFNIFGRPEKTYAKEPKQVLSPAAGFWPGAGNTPSYWYSRAAVIERKKKVP